MESSGTRTQKMSTKQILISYITLNVNQSDINQRNFRIKVNQSNINFMHIFKYLGEPVKTHNQRLWNPLVQVTNKSPFGLTISVPHPTRSKQQLYLLRNHAEPVGIPDWPVGDHSTRSNIVSWHLPSYFRWRGHFSSPTKQSPPT